MFDRGIETWDSGRSCGSGARLVRIVEGVRMVPLLRRVQASIPKATVVRRVAGCAICSWVAVSKTSSPASCSSSVGRTTSV
jgi:hypothetical protein